MAIDSRSKRASAVGVTLAWLLAPVLPDGAMATADRLHTAWSYSGISIGVVVASAVHALVVPTTSRSMKTPTTGRTLTTEDR